MAEIEPLQRTVRLPGAQPVPQVPNTGEAIARGLEALGETGERIAGAMAEQRDRRELAEARLAARRSLSDFALELERDDDPGTWTERLDAHARELQGQLSEGLSRRAQAAFTEEFGFAAQREREQVALKAERRMSQRAVATLEDGLAGLARDAASAETPQRFETVKAAAFRSIADLQAAGDLTPEQAEALGRDWLEDADQVRVLQAIAADPKAALDALDDHDRFEGLRPLLRERLKDRARSEIAQAARAARAARTEARALAREGIGELEQMAAEALPPDPEFLANTRGVVEDAADPALARRFNRAAVMAARINRLRGAAPQEVQEHIHALAARINRKGATPDARAELEGAEKLLSTMSTELARDPLSWAARQGAVEVTPLDVDNLTPEALIRRVRQGDLAAEHYGTPPRYLTDEETDRLSAAVAEATPERQAEIASQISAAGPGKAPAIFGEVAKNDPVFAHAGGLMAMGDRFKRAAADALRGRAALKENPDLRPETADIERPLAEELGNALPVNRESRGAIVKSAAAIYAARVEPGAGFDGEVYRRALQEAAGAWFDGKGRQWGGVTDYRGADVIAPPHIRADRFERAVRNLGEGDLILASGNEGGFAPVFRAPDGKVTPFTPDDLDDVWLVNVGAGRYVLSQTRPGSRPAAELELVSDSGTGAPYILDLNRLEHIGERPVRPEADPLAAVGGPL